MHPNVERPGESSQEERLEYCSFTKISPGRRTERLSVIGGVPCSWGGSRGDMEESKTRRSFPETFSWGNILSFLCLTKMITLGQLWYSYVPGSEKWLNEDAHRFL